MSVDELKQIFFTLKDEHDVFRDAFLKEFSEKAMQAFVTDPLSVCVNYPDKTREESLVITWHENKRRMEESLARKASRMLTATNAFLLESNFQEQHAKVATVVDGQILCGYYKVMLTSTHYEFVLIRTNVPDDEIRSKVIVPFGTVMGEGPWSDVTPGKINLVYDEDDRDEGYYDEDEQDHDEGYYDEHDDDDHICHECKHDLDDCPEGGDHTEEHRYLEQEGRGRRHLHE